MDQSPAAGIQDHWVVLYAKDANDYLMWDPYRTTGDDIGKTLRLMDRYKNSGTTPAQAITSVIFFSLSGKPPTALPTPTPPPAAAPTPTVKLAIPSDSISLKPNVDGVAFRVAGDVTGLLIRRFSLDTTLLSLESRASTLNKLGVYGQWLHIQAPEGDQGYVAAWYIQNSSGIIPNSPAASTNVIVKVIQDQLAFRNQPLIADTTLIKRLPLGAQLTVTDPNGVTYLGQMNQWLKVKDSTGQEGFVAAWYVAR